MYAFNIYIDIHVYCMYKEISIYLSIYIYITRARTHTHTHMQTNSGARLPCSTRNIILYLLK